MIWNMVQTARTCVVTFKSSVDESVLYTIEVDAGSSVTYGGKTPTKSSTAQYTYTFSGWSRTKGGNAVSGILNDIEEDITLWSAFTSTVRKYTITWKNYDGSTIGTTSVAYGSVPSHAAVTFGGYTSTGWNPTPKAVTGTATYTATYSLPQGMEETITKDWDQIIADAAAKNSTGYSSLDTKVMLCTNGDALCFEICALGNDAGSTFSFLSRTAAGSCVYNSSRNDSKGYLSSYLKTAIEGTLLSRIPANIKAALKTVTKYCCVYMTESTLSYTAKVWPPCYREMFGLGIENAGPTYPCYNQSSLYAKRIRYTQSGSPVTAWLSTVGGTTSSWVITTSGFDSMSAPSNTQCAVYGFCL